MLGNILGLQRSSKEIGYANNFELALKQYNDAHSEITKLQMEIRELNVYNTAPYYNLDEITYLYQKQILLSKGLLRDNITGATVGGRPFQYMTITELGIKFIEFIMR